MLVILPYKQLMYCTLYASYPALKHLMYCTLYASYPALQTADVLYTVCQISCLTNS